MRKAEEADASAKAAVESFRKAAEEAAGVRGQDEDTIRGFRGRKGAEEREIHIKGDGEEEAGATHAREDNTGPGEEVILSG